jgi:hypothetical protein
MLTLVTFVPSTRGVPHAGSLTADYARFDRRRAVRRPYLKALLGFTVVLVVGAIAGRLPAGHAGAAIGACLAPAVWLAAAEWMDYHRLVRRLDRARAAVRSARKS